MTLGPYSSSSLHPAKSTVLENSIAMEFHQIQPRESHFLLTEDSTIMETAKEAQNAQPPAGSKGQRKHIGHIFFDHKIRHHH